MKLYSLWLIGFLGLLSACGGGDGGGGTGGGGWEVVGEKYFSPQVQNNFSIGVHQGTVYVGFYDVIENRPAVMKFSPSAGQWEYACGGPVPMDGISDSGPINGTFLFRQDGARSLVGFNTSYDKEQLVIFACDGTVWQRLADVPLELLPGFSEGFTSLVEQDFTFTAKDGRVYAVTNSTENAASPGQTCLSVFVHDGQSWGLAPQRLCHPGVIGGFGYEAIHSEVSVIPSPTAGLYIGALRYIDATMEKKAVVYHLAEGGWATLAEPGLIDVDGSATTEFSLAAAAEGGQDRLAVSIGGLDNQIHVFGYAAGSWEELPSPGTGTPDRIYPLALAGWPGRLFVAHSDVEILRYDGSSWSRFDKQGFSGDADSYYQPVLTTDDQYLYLVYRTKHLYPGKPVESLSVYRHRLP